MPPRAFVYSWCLDSLNVVLELCYSLSRYVPAAFSDPTRTGKEHTRHARKKKEKTHLFFSPARDSRKRAKILGCCATRLRALTSSHLAFSHQQSPCCYITLSLYTLVFNDLFFLRYIHTYITHTHTRTHARTHAHIFLQQIFFVDR